MGVETENYEIAAKGFENTDFVVCISSPAVSRQFLPVGYLKGRYKFESSLMTCVAELHGSVTRMPSSILSDMGKQNNRHTNLCVIIFVILNPYIRCCCIEYSIVNEGLQSFEIITWLATPTNTLLKLHYHIILYKNVILYKN